MKPISPNDECSVGDGASMSLSDIVRDYCTNRIHRKDGKTPQEHRKEELDQFRKIDSLNLAIETAAMSVDSQGKKFRHEWHISKDALEQATKALLAIAENLHCCSNFDELHKAVEEVRSNVIGVGPVYVYDVALRIGAKLGHLPERVYLHAGTRKGAENLGLDTGKGTLETKAIPTELHCLQPYEIEDVLCIYKDRLVLQRYPPAVG